jgi:hypothetical protein
MSRGTGTHFENPVLGSRDLYEDVPIDILSRTQRCGFFQDFVETASGGVTTGMWLSQPVVALTSSGVVLDTVNGLYRIVNGAVDAQGEGGVQMVGTSAPFAPARAFLTPSLTAAVDGNLHRIISFGAMVSISNYDISDFFIGLMGVDTTPMAATGLLTTTGFDNGVGFHHLVHANTQGGLTGPDGNAVRYASAGTAVANYQGTLSTSSTATGGAQALPADAAVDGIFIEYGIRIIGTSQVEFYMNRALRHRRTMSAVLASTLVPTFCFISNGTTNTMNIDYVWASQTR